MKKQLQQRLEELRTEFENGRKILAGLEAKQTHLNASLLRISGAIQILEELLGQTMSEDPSGEITGPENLKVAAIG